MKKKWLILIVGLVFLVCIVGLVFKVYAQDQPTIDVVLKNSNSQYWDIMSAGIVKGFHDFHAEGKIYTEGKDDSNQIKVLKTILAKKPDAIIVSLTNPSAALPILKEFHQQHIPVLLVDTPADWPDQTSYIGTDNPALGKMGGELLSSMLQPGDPVALLGNLENNTVSTDRTEGAKQALTAAGMQIVADTRISQKNDVVTKYMEELLKVHPDLEGVYAVNDEIALEILKYTKDKGIKLTVVGSDGIINMLQNIQNGNLQATLSQNPYDMGYLSVENAIQAIQGKKVEKSINSGVDIVTKDNVNDKIDFLNGILQDYSN